MKKIQWVEQPHEIMLPGKFFFARVWVQIVKNRILLQKKKSLKALLPIIEMIKSIMKGILFLDESSRILQQRE